MSHARDRIHKLIAVKKQSQNLTQTLVEMPLTHRRSSILPCHLSAKRLLWSVCPRFLLKVCPSPSPPYPISQLQCLLRGSQLAASLTLATIPHVTLVLLTELMGTDVVKSDAAVRWSHYSPASFIIKLFPAITSPCHWAPWFAGIRRWDPAKFPGLWEMSHHACCNIRLLSFHPAWLRQWKRRRERWAWRGQTGLVGHGRKSGYDSKCNHKWSEASAQESDMMSFTLLKNHSGC